MRFVVCVIASAALLVVAGCGGSVSGEASSASGAESSAAPSATASNEVKAQLTSDEQAFVEMATDDMAKVAEAVETISSLADDMPWGDDASLEAGTAFGDVRAIQTTWKLAPDYAPPRLGDVVAEWNTALASYAKAIAKLKDANDNGNTESLSQAKKLIRRGMREAERAADDLREIVGT
jgi:hypothetical protein